MRSLGKHPILKNNLISILIKKLLKNGKLAVIEKVVLNSFFLIKKQTNLNPILVLENSIKNIKLPIKFINTNIFNKYILRSNLDSVRVSINWIINLIKKRKGGVPLYKKLAFEILNLNNKKSSLLNKKCLYIKNSVSCNLLGKLTGFKTKRGKKVNTYKKFRRYYFFEKKLIFRVMYLNSRFNFIKSFY